MLPNDFARCADLGPDCPNAGVCQRRTDIPRHGAITYAAFTHRREAGASACESFIRHGVDMLALNSATEA